MKRLILVALLFAIAFTVVGDSASRRRLLLKQRIAAGGGVTYLIDEDFEGTGTPSGWFLGGSADYDYSATPLSGAQSLRAPASTDYGFSPSLTPDLTTVWGKVEFKAETLPASFSEVITVIDTGFNDNCEIYVNSSGTVTISTGSIFETTVSAMSAGTKYYIWFQFTRNGAADVWFNSSDTRPSSVGNNHAGAGAGASNVGDIDSFRLGNASGSQPVVFDNFKIAATEFQ